MEISSITTTLAGRGVAFILGKLIKEPFEVIAKWCCQEAYQISTLHKSHREMQGLCRNKLDKYVEYNINWNKLFLGKEQSTCTLWIKAPKGKTYRKLIFCITASLETLRYQSVVTVFDVNEVPCVVAIPSIPFRSLEFHGKIPREPYSNVSIELKEIFDTDNVPISLQSAIKKVLHPVDNFEAAMGLRKSNVYRWGRWWNLDYLESEKYELAVTLHGLSFRASYQRQYSVQFWKILAWLSGKKWFLEICFWSKNIFFARHLKRKFSKYLDDDNALILRSK